MSGSGGDDPGERLYTLEEMDRHVLPHAADIDHTTADVILLLLGADPRPIVDKDALVSQVFLAVTGPLARSGVEPIAFRRGRGGRPRSAHVELALDHLAFTKNVDALGGSGGRAGPGIAITAKGRRRVAAKRRRLPAAVRSALARKRAEWGGDAPACRMEDNTYVHNRELLERLPAPGGRSDSGRRKGDRRAGRADPRSRGGSAPPAGTVSDSGIEECHAEACALAAGGDHEAAISLFERAILLDPAHAASYRGKAESLSALGRREEAARFRGAADLLEPDRGAAAEAPEEGNATAPDGTLAEGGQAASPGARSPVAVRIGPAPGKRRRYPRIRGFPSIAGALLELPNEDEPADILTQFGLYRDEQLLQSGGIFTRNVINDLLSNLVFPRLLRAFGGRPVPEGFDIYAVHIIMRSKLELNDVLINEDVKLDVIRETDKQDHEDGDGVFAAGTQKITSISESDRDPDAAVISLLRINDSWFGKFDLIYNRGIVHQKLERAVKFLNDSIQDNNSLESRYDLLWSGCELLGECMLLLHNILPPRSRHWQIQKTLGPLLRQYNSTYINEYNEIAQIRESLRYGPPHPDRSGEAKKKMAHLQDASMEFAAFAIGFLGGRQVSASDGDPRTVDGADLADASGKGKMSYHGFCVGDLILLDPLSTRADRAG